MNVDPTGSAWWNWLLSIGQIIVGGLLVVTGVGAGFGAALVAGGALGTAAFVAGTAISATTALTALAGVVVGSFAAGVGIYALETHLNGEEFKWNEALISGGFLAIESAMNFGMGLALGVEGYWPQNPQGYKGVFSKIKGNVKFVIKNIKTVMERTYIKTALIWPVSFILDSIKGELF